MENENESDEIFKNPMFCEGDCENCPCYCDAYDDCAEEICDEDCDNCSFERYMLEGEDAI